MIISQVSYRTNGPLVMYFLTINIINALFFMKHEHVPQATCNHDFNQSQGFSDVAHDVGFGQYITEFTVTNF